MSINIDWDKLQEDITLNETLRKFLDDQFQQLELPNYLLNIKVTKFSLGTVAPNLTIRHISDPFPDFYSYDNSSSDRSPTETETDVYINLRSSDFRDRLTSVDQSSNISRNEPDNRLPTDEEQLSTDEFSDAQNRVANDIQFLVEIEYQGDITIEIHVDLLLNYPSPGFITLPVKLRILDLGIHSLAALAYLKKCVFLSFLCDVKDERFDDIMKNPSLLRNNRTRIDIVRTMRMESEIGDNQGEGSVLRNVGKVEKFLTDMVRGLLRDELAWPGWISFDFNDDADEMNTEGDCEEDFME